MAIERLERPMGGEAWTVAPPATMPWDRPPQFAEVPVGLGKLFDTIKSPKMSRKLINLLDAGIPIDILAEGVLSQGLGQGHFGATGLMGMIGPTIVIMSRMADEVGITPRYSTDPSEKRIDFEPDELFLAGKNFNNGRDNEAMNAGRVATISSDELSSSTGFV
jgi:hypothetical protein